ncbi:MAG: hypothetical protein ABSE16_03675 [Verrucomicrobiota bacterium]|jgi:adenosylhomocysteine nucleosidase
MSVLVCFALKEEAARFRKIAAGKPGVAILITGIGRRNAEESLRKFFDGGPSVPAGRLVPAPNLVLTCGFAGGLNPKLQAGEVIFQTADENLRARLLAAGAKPAEFFFAGRIATTVAEKKLLHDETGCDAVEMESEAIWGICIKHDIPCATVRVISDTAGEDLPLDFNALSKPDQSLDYGKLLLAVAKSPGKIAALRELQKKTRFAADELAGVLAKIIFP